MSDAQLESMLDLGDSEDDNDDDDEILAGIEESKVNADDASGSSDESDDDDEDADLEEDSMDEEPSMKKNTPSTTTTTTTTTNGASTATSTSTQTGNNKPVTTSTATTTKPTTSSTTTTTSKPTDKKNLQISASFPEEAGETAPKGYEEIPASQSGADEKGGYTRVVPKRFTEMRDDRLMNSLISKYAREVRRDGKNTGHFFLNREDAQDAVKEVLETHRD